ncbi:MAG: hypothetical protein N2112_10430 [Gemmataceae bacterium]|nr:hypothetical protein [Gemmataceae bacterium]
MQTRIIRIFLFLLITPNWSLAGDREDELFKMVLEGHQQLVELMIEGCEIKTERTRMLDDKVTDKQFMEWKQVGDKIRIRTTTEIYDVQPPPIIGKDVLQVLKSQQDYLRDGTQQLSINNRSVPQSKDIISALITETTDYHSIGVSVWVSTNHIGAAYPSEIWLYETLRQPGKLLTCKWTHVKGEKLILVEKAFEKRTYRVLFDPQNQFYPVSLSHFTGNSTDKSQLVTTTEVTKFHPKDESTGIRFPAEIVTSYVTPKRGDPVKKTVTIVTSALFKQKFPEEVFSLTIPAGVPVVNKITGKAYISQGGTTPDLAKYNLRLDDIEITKPLPLPPPEPEPSRWSLRWVSLAIAVIFFLAAFGLWRTRRGSDR